MSLTVESKDALSSPETLKLTPVSRSFRYQSLDFWRGVACITVAVGHYIHLDPNYQSAGWPYLQDAVRWMFLRMWIGVPMFFVISGYCIAASAELQAAKREPWFTFFKKRARRIFPPYWAWIGISALIAFSVHSLDSPHHRYAEQRFLSISPFHWFANLTLTETWLGSVFGYPFNWNDFYLAHAWTLCYEEQFYAVTGLLLLLMGRHYLAGAMLVTAVVFARCGFFSANMNSGFFFDGRWLSFAAGVAVFCSIHSRSPWSRWIARLYLAAGLVWAGRSPLTILTLHHSADHEYFGAFAFAWLLIALHGSDKLIHESRLLKPLTFCGSFCYSFYLVHLSAGNPVAVWFHTRGYLSIWQQLFPVLPAALASTIVVGYLFHLLVERRFQSASMKTASKSDGGASPATVTEQPRIETPIARAA